jgi:hypothetical protein
MAVSKSLKHKGLRGAMLLYLGISTMKTKAINKDGIKIYPVTYNLVDLFWGVGWGNTARFKFVNNEWVLWKKTSSLPRNYKEVLNFYRSIKNV